MQLRLFCTNPLNSLLPTFTSISEKIKKKAERIFGNKRKKLHNITQFSVRYITLCAGSCT